MAREQLAPGQSCARTYRIGERGFRQRRERLGSGDQDRAWQAQLTERFEAGVLASRFDKLPIDFSHAEAVTTLPRHHDDPFDRMLIAQAITERLTLVTHDRRFVPYGINVVWT